jgi:hypothetical protein
MGFTKQLTQQKFREILFNTYLKGQESKTISAEEIIEEIKKQILTGSK